MSKKKASANKASTKKAGTIKETPPLTTEYHNARRQLVLWSGILFAWEFIGIDLKAMQNAEGTLGALAKSLKSPQAVPWILLILVMYFFYRCFIEFFQCNPERRVETVSIMDIMVTIGIAIIAISLFFTHKLLNVQVAEGKSLLGNIISIITFIAIGLFFGVVSSFISEFRKMKKEKYFSYILFFLIIFSIPSTYIIFWIAFNIKALDPDARISNLFVILIGLAIIMIAIHFLPRLKVFSKKKN